MIGFDCKMATCVKCSLEFHKLHKFADVNEVADEYRLQMTDDARKVIKTVARYRKRVKRLESEKLEFCDRADRVEKTIWEQVELLKQTIDREHTKLVAELNAMRADRITLVNDVLEQTKQFISYLESLIEYTDDLKNNGRAADIVLQLDPLHSRTEDVLYSHTIQKEIDDLGSVDVTFSATNWLTKSNEINLGHVEKRLIEGE